MSKGGLSLGVKILSPCILQHNLSFVISLPFLGCVLSGNADNPPHFRSLLNSKSRPFAASFLPVAHALGWEGERGGSPLDRKIEVHGLWAHAPASPSSSPEHGKHLEPLSRHAVGFPVLPLPQVGVMGATLLLGGVSSSF